MYVKWYIHIYPPLGTPLITCDEHKVAPLGKPHWLCICTYCICIYELGIYDWLYIAYIRLGNCLLTDISPYNTFYRLIGKVSGCHACLTRYLGTVLYRTALYCTVLYCTTPPVQISPHTVHRPKLPRQPTLTFQGFPSARWGTGTPDVRHSSSGSRRQLVWTSLAPLFPLIYCVVYQLTYLGRYLST